MSGFLTPPGSALVASVMLVGIMTVHLKNGVWLTHDGYEYALLTGVAAPSLAFVGPGLWSAEALPCSSFAGVARGISVIVVAVLGAVVQLAQRQALPVAVQSEGVSRQVS